MTIWHARNLSHAGRLQLMQTVLFGIQSYWSQLFIIPAKILKLIVSNCRRYLWSGNNAITKNALVAWGRMCTPKSIGALNLINTHLWNKAAIAKTSWDRAHKQNILWIRWIHTYYITTNSVSTAPTPNPGSWMIRKMMTTGILEQTRTLTQRPTSIRTIYLKPLCDNPRVPWSLCCLAIMQGQKPDLLFGFNCRTDYKLLIGLVGIEC